MVIVGLDPSYTNTGIAIIDSKRIKLTSVGSVIGDKTFKNVFMKAVEISSGVESLISDICSGTFCLISEVPPPQGQFASGLYGLDILLLHRMNLLTPEVYGVYPTYIGHVHGTRKYHKSDSVNLCKKLLELFRENGYSIEYKGRLSNDCAEAFIIALRLWVKKNPGHKLLVEIKKVSGGFFNEKEFLISEN